jgi:hypothetical protein
MLTAERLNALMAATVELERRMTGWAHRSGMSQG